MKGKPGKTWDSRTAENTLYNVQGNSAPTGTSKDATLRRLRKDRPELWEKVEAGGKGSENENTTFNGIGESV
jgi:hypothetical protein